jgi:uncharacterized repeat protein (TIGR03806 family)
MRHAVLLCALAACGADDAAGFDASAPVRVNLDEPMPERLSAFNLLAWDADAGAPTFNEDVAPYDLNLPLFSDYAVKYRAIYVPRDAAAPAFDADSVLDFPVGSVLVKSFVFPADLRAPTDDATIIETRVLARFPAGWEAFPYVWNDEQTDAILTPAGGIRTITLVDTEGAPQTANYLIPQKTQCGSCHSHVEGGTTTMTLLGPSGRQLHRDDQLVALANAGVVANIDEVITPAFDARVIEAGTVAPADVDRAARDYLDANCAHCHSPTGVQGTTSQLFLDRTNTDLFRLGVCKQPGSAGLGTGGFKYDIVPGNAAMSILQFRIETTELGAMMPLLGRSLVHTRGAALIRTWIDAMPPSDPPNCGL